MQLSGGIALDLVVWSNVLKCQTWLECFSSSVFGVCVEIHPSYKYALFREMV